MSVTRNGHADGTLGWLSWQRPLVGAEPVPAPVWTGRPPDAEQIRRSYEDKSNDEHARVNSLQSIADDFAGVYKAGRVTVIVGIVSTALWAVGLLIWVASGQPLTMTLSPEFLDVSAGPAQTLFFLGLFAPWVGAFAMAKRRSLAGRDSRVWPMGLKLWFALLVPGVFSLMLAFPLGTIVIGLYVLRSRPDVYWRDLDTTSKLPESLEPYYKSAVDAVEKQREYAASIDHQAGQEIERRQHDYRTEVARFEQAKRDWKPYRIVAAPEQQDLLIVGGGRGERGDLLHHFAAGALRAYGAAWVLDLEGLGASDRLRGELAIRDLPFTLVDAKNENALIALVDSLDPTGTDRRSPLLGVLAHGLAYDDETANSKSVRATAARLDELRAQLGRVSTKRLYHALQAVSGRSAAPMAQASVDDFGFTDRVLDSAADSELTAAELGALRSAFTDQDRQQLHATWTDLRDKLGTLDPDDYVSAIPPSFDATQLTVCVTPQSLPKHDWELRGHLLAGYAMELLRSGRSAPAALAVVGADRLPVETLRQLSDAASHRGVQLMLMFTELTDPFTELAKGRRVVGVFGGHGAEAAETLSKQFGSEWVERVASLQESWSDTDTRARALQSGRNWGTSQGDSWNDGDSWNESSGNGQSRSRGGSSTRSSGGSNSTTDTSSVANQRGGSVTRNRDYEQRVRGDAIATLPPYVLLLKTGDQQIRTLDVKADLPLPATVLTAELAPRSATSIDADAALSIEGTTRITASAGQPPAHYAPLPATQPHYAQGPYPPAAPPSIMPTMPATREWPSHGH